MVLSLTPEAETGEMEALRFPFDYSQPLNTLIQCYLHYQNLDSIADPSWFQC